MKKKTFILLLVAAMTFTAGALSLSYAADSQDKLDNIDKEKSDVSSDMESLTDSIIKQQAEIEKIQASADEKESEIDKTLVDIQETKDDIESRQDGLDSRLRTMYKNGSIGYLDVILGSGSLSELISNIDMVQRIYKNDHETLATLENQHKKLESKQNTLKEQQAELETERASAQSKQDALKEDQDALKAKYDELEAEGQRIRDEIAASMPSGGGGSGESGSSGGGGGSESGGSGGGDYEGGTFIWPTTSHVITSEFGYRYHPIFGDWRGHTGVDIGAGYGQPIYAAADGTVMFAGGNASSGYGYYITINHGGGIATLYGHSSKLLVSSGQSVKKGQVIAKVGSTGWSTGSHLHFEVMINGNPVNPMNYF